VKIKCYYEKLGHFGFDWKKNGISLIILVKNKLPPIYDLFIQYKNKCVEMSQGTHKHKFRELYKVLINEQYMLISSRKIIIWNSHVALGGKFQSKGPKKDVRPSHTSSTNVFVNTIKPSNNTNIGTSLKEWKVLKYCTKSNHSENNCFKRCKV